MYKVISKVVWAVGVVLMLTVLVVGLFVAVMGVVPVVMGMCTSDACIAYSVCALMCAFMLLLGNHREDCPIEVVTPNYGKRTPTIVKGTMAGDKVYLANPPLSEVKVTW